MNNTPSYMLESPLFEAWPVGTVVFDPRGRVEREQVTKVRSVRDRSRDRSEVQALKQQAYDDHFRYDGYLD